MTNWLLDMVEIFAGPGRVAVLRKWVERDSGSRQSVQNKAWKIGAAVVEVAQLDEFFPNHWDQWP